MFKTAASMNSLSCDPHWMVAGMLSVMCGPPSVHPLVFMTAQGTDAQGILERPMAAGLELHTLSLEHALWCLRQAAVVVVVVCSFTRVSSMILHKKVPSSQE